MIDYSEFLIANLSLKNVLTTDKIQAAFDILDRDGDGKITKADLAQIFINKDASANPAN